MTAITVLDRDTELAETVLLRPPRVLGHVAGMAALLLGSAALWAWLTTVDRVVKAPVRVRNADSPLKEFSAPSGVDASAAAAGQLVELRFHEGDHVRAGDVLALLDTRRIDNDLEKLRLRIAADREEDARQAKLLESLEAQRDADLAKSRSEVETVGRELDAARARVAEERAHRASSATGLVARVAQLEQDVEAKRALVPRVVSKREFAVAEAELAEARARLRDANLDPGDTPVRLAEAQLASAQHGIAAVEQGLETRRSELELQAARRRGEMEALTRDAANLELARSQCQVLAPIDGVISAARVQPGQFAQAGQALATIADEHGFRVDAAVAAADIGHVKPGMRARVKLTAYDFQRYGALDATVVAVSPDSSAGEQGGAFYVVRLTIDHTALRGGEPVKLGMTGVAEIATDRDRLLRILANAATDTLTP